MMPNSRILRRTDVEDKTGLCRSTIYRLMSEDQFPKPIRIGSGAVGWLEGEVESYIAARIAERDSVVG